MKLLILGNHTCGNRGDSAILRGLLDAINILNPHAEVDVMSRYPVSSSWLLNRPVMGDPLFLQMKQQNSAAGVVGRVKKVLRRRYQHQVLLSRVTDTGKLRNIAIAQGFTDFVRLLSGYDAIIQVGGSFFVDLYGVPQFEHALCTFMAKKPLPGWSIAPSTKGIRSLRSPLVRASTAITKTTAWWRSTCASTSAILPVTT